MIFGFFELNTYTSRTDEHLFKTEDESLTLKVAAEKGRSMGNAVGCPTEWADEMEESEILENSAFSRFHLVSV